MEKIRLFIADDVNRTRENIKRILDLEEDIEIVGEAGDGLQAVEQAEQIKPDIILMDINMPKMDGIAAAEAISMTLPETTIIMMSVQEEQEYLKKSMAAGAKEYITKPFSFDDLTNTIRNVYQLEQKRRQLVSQVSNKADKGPGHKAHVTTVFGTKGGIGKSTVAVNLAVALAQEEKKKVAILDLDLQFGDVAVMFNVLPKRTINELTQELSNLDAQGLEKFLVSHKSGVKILPAPNRPEYAELITADQIESIINLLKENYDYVIVDTPPFFHDTNMTALDMSDQIILLAALDLPTIKNIRLNMEVFETLHYMGKTMLAINRASDEIGIKVEDLEHSLSFLSACLIPSDGKLVVSSINKGVPFVTAVPGAKISNSINKLCKLVQRKTCLQAELKAQRQTGLFAKMLRGVT